MSSWNHPKNDLLSPELREAIRHMVANISKSFIVEWYTSISPTNHDFVVCCETLIEDALNKLAELSVQKLDKYKVGQLIASLLHEHVINENSTEKKQSIENQIDNHEYDICQNSVVRLFGLLCTEDLRKVIFTKLPTIRDSSPYRSHAGDLGYRKTTTTNYHQEKAYSNHYHDQNSSSSSDPRTTSALYTLVIAMLTKAVFMPIVNSISEPRWLYAIIIWLCKKEERELAKRKAQEDVLRQQTAKDTKSNSESNCNGTLAQKAAQSNQVRKIDPKTSIIVTNPRGYRSIDLEEGIDIAAASINFKDPICGSLKRPLDNIEIYDTEEVKSNNSCYVLYCIRYDGLCQRHPSAGFSFIPENPDIPVIDKRATNCHQQQWIVLNSNEASTSNDTNNSVPDNRKYFRRKMTIKRRFREFVILQLRLEENPKIRPYMKNIPKPTKLKAATQSIFTLPGIANIKLDQSTVKLRQRFLERFLIALNSSPFIANSYEFKEFLSYSVTPVNISKSRSLILRVNLNKVFVDSVRSALSIIRSSLPDVRKSVDSINELGSSPDPDAWLVELQQSTMKLHVQTRTTHSKMTLERFIDSKLLVMDEKSARRSLSLDRQNNLLGLQVPRDSSGYYSRGGSLRSNMLNTESMGSITNSSSLLFSRTTSTSSSHNTYSGYSSRSDSSESIYYDASSDPVEITSGTCDSIQICDSVPIASKFIDIVHYSISGNSSCSSSIINFMVRLVIGKLLESHAIKLLEAAFTLNTASFCINGITSSIWDESDDPPLDLENASLNEAVVHLSKLLEKNYANYTFIPKQLIRSFISKQIRFYLSQLSSHKRNKFVIYSFFVHLLDELEVPNQ